MPRTSEAALRDGNEPAILQKKMKQNISERIWLVANPLEICEEGPEDEFERKRTREGESMRMELGKTYVKQKFERKKKGKSNGRNVLD